MAESAKEGLGSISSVPLYPMPKPRRNAALLPLDDTLFPVKQRKPIPHEFVLDAIAPPHSVLWKLLGCDRFAARLHGSLAEVRRSQEIYDALGS